MFSGVAKWNLFHCLTCLDAPSLGPNLVLSQFQVLLSHLWELKKKKDIRQKRYKGRERRSRTRKEEREEEGVKRKKKKIIIKNYFKKQNQNQNKTKQACWFQTGQASFAGLFGGSQGRWPIPDLLCPDQDLGSLLPSFPVAPGPTSSGIHPTLGYGCSRGAFLDLHSPWCLWSQVPPRCVLSPQCLGFGLDNPHSPTGAQGGWVDSRLELLLQGNSP